MMNKTFERTRAFIYRSARPLDLARWQYHFENGSKEAVIKALSVYQNGDGGFGHALEPDMWNPNSSPMQTWAATEILRETGFEDAAHPVIRGILSYLENTGDFNSHYWYASIKSNGDFPHAPWWGFSDDPDHLCNNYNPTACLAGFIIRFAGKNCGLYKLGCKIAGEACEFYAGRGLINDMHAGLCFVRLWQYCEEAGVTETIGLASLKERLRGQVKHNITENTAEWETGYVCRPSQFFNSRDSIFYTDNRDIAGYECEFIIRSQLEDGSWNIPWEWGDYPEEWAVSKNRWKGSGAVLNMLYLKGMGRLT